MPIYEYQCNACGHKMEAIQKISDDPLKDCPECHKDQLQKLVSPAGFQLKGSGWYKTDYKGKEKSKEKVDTDKKTVSEGENKTSATKDKADSSSSSGNKE